MLVACPCGKNLNVAESLVGKKVRCPVCKDVFLVQVDKGGQKSGGSVPEEGSMGRSRESAGAIQRKQLSIKQKQARPLEEEEADLLEEVEEEQPRSIRKQGKRVTAAKSSVGLWRNIISTVILGVLLIVLGIVVWTKLRGSGTVVLEYNVGGVTVFADGKEIEPSTEDARMGQIMLTLSPGDHEVKSIKAGFEPDVRHFTIDAGSSGHYNINLRSAERRKPNGVSQQDDLVVTAEALIDELAVDNEAANRKYVRRNLIVSGTVHSIQKVEPVISVIFTSVDKGINEGFVACEFTIPTPETVNRIKEGQRIKVRGICKATGLRSMGLAQVTLVEP